MRNSPEQEYDQIEDWALTYLAMLEKLYRRRCPEAGLRWNLLPSLDAITNGIIANPEEFLKMFINARKALP